MQIFQYNDQNLNRNVSVEDLGLEYGCSIDEFATKLFEMLKDSNFDYGSYHIYGYDALESRIIELVDEGQVGEPLDEIIIASKFLIDE